MYTRALVLILYTRPIYPTYIPDLYTRPMIHIPDLYTRPIYPTYIPDLYTRPIYFGLVDVPLVQVQVLTHVGEVGQGHKQVVLHTTGQSKPFLDIYSLILKSYLILFDYSLFDSQLPGLSYFAGSTSPDLLRRVYYYNRSTSTTTGSTSTTGCTSTTGSTLTGQLRRVYFDHLFPIGKQ